MTTQRNTVVPDAASLGDISTKWWELFRRTKEGTIPWWRVSRGLQRLSENRSSLYIHKLLPLTVNYQLTLAALADTLPPQTLNRQHFADNDYYVKRWDDHVRGRASFTTTAVVCEIDECTSSDDILHTLNVHGLGPASEIALLFLCAQHPHLLTANEPNLVATEREFFAAEEKRVAFAQTAWNGKPQKSITPTGTFMFDVFRGKNWFLAIPKGGAKS